MRSGQADGYRGMETEMTATYGLDDFIQEVRAASQKQLSSAETLRTIAPGFKKLLNNRDFLQQRLASMGAVGDEVCLHADADNHFVILARGVSRGQSHAGSPHDHGSLWALYGIYEGSARFQRYEIDSANQGGPFPGLRLISERPAMPGDYDAIEPGNMHLPVFPPEGGSVIIVVYKDDLESVVRCGYLREIQQPVRFRGQFPSRENRVE
jgi:predicted metal-dependent enzyme (double-stranded beta helix superfamily)